MNVTDSLSGSILVIDDEVGPRESLRILLNDRYKVTCKISVDQGLDVLKTDPPDLIIMDIRMPGKSGIDGLREIRHLNENVPVVMLTGYGALETAQEAIRHGANDYIKKPFEIDEMLEVIDAQLKVGRVRRLRNRAALDLQNLNSRLVEQLTQKEELASMGQTTAEIMHDLRNPMSIVIGYVELLSHRLKKLKGDFGADYQSSIEYLDIIQKNVERCREMAATWQSQTHSSTGKMEPILIEDLVSEILYGLEALAVACSTELITEVNCPGAVVLMNSEQLPRAMHNLLSNALQAVTDQHDGRIEVRAIAHDSLVEFTVLDNGPGIPDELMDKIFQPYFTTKEKGKGTGLGLSITRKIVEEHSGHVEIRSQVGQGTCVKIFLPQQTTGTEA